MGQRTLARPLALLLAALIVYASLYPFEGWRLQGGNPMAFLWAPFPRYWTVFDVSANLVGYVPLGFLSALVAVRSGGSRRVLVVAFFVPTVLSLGMETTQVFLPSRVPSNVDWLLNTLGGLMGSTMVLVLSRTRWLASWQRLRSNWFEADAHGALVLLALWPVALLYPTSLPFGLGQVWWAIESWVAQALAGTAQASWLPVRVSEPQLLAPLAQAWCVALGLLAPCMLGYSVLRGAARRGVLLLGLWLLAVAAMGLSSALTFSPAHAWTWLTPPVLLGMALGLVAGVLGMALSRGACAVWLVWVLLAGLALLNSAPVTPYLAESLHAWSQGRFIRFHGLTQWVGWVWPYAVMAHAAVQVSWQRGAGRSDAHAMARPGRAD